MKSRTIIGIVAALALLIGGYFYLDSLLFDGVKPGQINDQEFKATIYAQSDIQNRPAVVLMGGGEWGAFWGQELAKANYVGLSIPYHRQEGLPSLPEEIPLDYFEKALDWLKQQPQVNPEKIVVMGASRNAELALLVASYYPECVSGAIAYSPSSVSWSNTVLPYNSDVIKPSWTFENKPVPFIPMAKLKDGESDNIETLSYWKQGLLDSLAVSQASIPVENINGPILLFSGLDDEVWPSAKMSNMITERMKNNALHGQVENIQYEQAGHLISGNPNNLSASRQGTMVIDGRTYQFNFGGTSEGDMAAQKDAAKRVFDFLSKITK